MAKRVEDVISQIQALMNKAEGAKSIGELQEAENASSLAQKLLMKHNLSMDEVQETEIKKRSMYTNEPIFTGAMADKREGDWITKLYNGVAVNNLCKVRTQRGYVRIYGHTDNVALVMYICDQLIIKIRMAEKGAWNKYQREEKRGTFRRGFFEGAAYGIQARLSEDLRNMKQDENPYAVMIHNSEKELQEYLWELFPSTRPRTEEEIRKDKEDYDAWYNALSDKEKKKWDKPAKIKMRKGPKGLKSNDGWAQGHEAGKQMTINKGMETNTPKGIFPNMSIDRTPEFLEASAKLMPLLKSIPKETIKRHNLVFEDIINKMIDLKNQEHEPKLEIETLLAFNLAYYIMYGKCKEDYEQDTSK